MHAVVQRILGSDVRATRWMAPHGVPLLRVSVECAIGLGLLTGVMLRATILLMFLQLLGTVAPLFLFPGETFTRFPYAPTLEGQYIIKNLVLGTAAIVIGATVRGGDLVAEPQLARPHEAIRAHVPG